MADKIYIGAVVDTAEVGKINVGGTIAVGNTFTVTLGKASVTFTTTTTVVADAVAGILALLQATTARDEFQAITWTSGTGYVQGTGPSDGYPWIDGLSVAKAQGSGGSNTHTISITTVTAGTGSLTWSDTGNWAGGVIPVAGDTIHVGLYGVVPKYKIDRNGLASTCSLIIYSGNTSNLFIGLSEVNSSGYPEYLNRYLVINAKLTYGVGTGPYVPKLNFALDHIGTANQTHIVYRSEARDNGGKAPLQIKGRSSGSYLPSFDINGGNVDLSLEEGETVYSNTLGNVTCSGDLRVYGKWTCQSTTTLSVKGFVFWGSIGTAGNYTMPQDITVFDGGTLRVGRDGNTSTTYADVALLQNNSGGTVYWNRPNTSNPVITTVKNLGTLDFSEDIRGSKKITNLVCYQGSEIIDPNGVTQITKITLEKCGLAGNLSASLDLGIDRELNVVDEDVGDLFTLTYRVGNSSTSEGEISSDLGVPDQLAIYTTDANLIAMLENLLEDAVVPGNSGSILQLDDGTTSVLVRVKASHDYGTPNIYAIDTWYNPQSTEYFADSTTITLTRIS